MKLLVVSQYFAPENFRINDLVAGMVARGHQVTVLTGQPNYPQGQFFTGYGWHGPRDETLCGAEVVRVPLMPRGAGGGLRLMLNYLSFVVTGIWGALFRLRGDFDAIFVFEVSPVTVGIPAMVASRRFRAPVLFWVLDLWPESLEATGAIRHRGALALVGHGVRWIYQRCARVLVASQAFMPSVVEFGTHPADVRYFPNWVEGDYRAEADCELPALPAGFLVIFAGNLGAAQDLPAVLRAAAATRDLTDVHWVFAGDGRMAGWAREEVIRLSLRDRVHFLGQLPSAKMPALFARAAALLVSLRPEPIFAKTVPGKVQSYMASGRPMLAMLDGEGARLVNEAGCGLACAGGDSEALAAHVRALRGMDEVQREAMGRAGRAYADAHFDRDRLFDQLIGWIDEVVREQACSKTN
ncbi:glycosyltransferase family 4 protein [Denitromonas iodatirespirans]|uniref:Glycosyltransferase family 4 protein n=1 Tax=Denitromonas iodatirespirans TaxID=2795389 RepID=A0A944D996_DENI1|nr:glycosyltransferase family 4 protein [Denitromonas iodatirespirans]MBT0962324.1 glycosyltransferase family 4 protein [Denitromonas iodatirespirans]